MLKNCALILLLSLSITPVLARTNAQIGQQLYNVANQMAKHSTVRSEEMKDNIESFLLDANMLHFNENTAVWKKLPNGWYYDSKSLWSLYNRHMGVYKTPNGLAMGIFDLNCEDFNDVQERQFGYVIKTEVYFSLSYRPPRGRSTGIYKTFCK